VSHPARRLWFVLEPLHDVVYFTPEVREAGIGLGLRGYWMTYFAFRAAPLGSIGAAPVAAMFAGFAPTMVAKALPDAWSRTTPSACLGARIRVSVDALRRLNVDPGGAARAAALLSPAVEGADHTGRPLFAANASLAPYDDPLADLWQVTASLREHRGDGHVAALAAAGVSGLEAHLLQVAKGTFTEGAIRSARGWTDQEWKAAAERLRDRGLLGAGPVPVLTPAGRNLLDDVESRTDEAAWSGALAVLGEQGVEAVEGLLEPAVAAVRASGMLPDVSPTGLPSRCSRSAARPH
jgi:hypothetical protein